MYTKVDICYPKWLLFETILITLQIYFYFIFTQRDGKLLIVVLQNIFLFPSFQ